MEFKDYFRDELDYLNGLSAEFAEDHPELNDFFSSSAADSDVESLIENFAFFTAKLRLKLDDAFPEITQSLLEKVWASPLRPLPATTIVQFTPKEGGEIRQIAKGSRISGESQSGKLFDFCVSRALSVLPIKLLNSQIIHNINGSQLILKFQWQGIVKEGYWHPEAFSFYLGSNEEEAQLLKLWFNHYLNKVQLIFNDQQLSLSSHIVCNAGKTKNDLILPLEVEQYWRLQLMQEAFSYAHIDDFIHIDLAKEIGAIYFPDEQVFSLVFCFNRILPMQLQGESDKFLLNCVPALNLFERESGFYSQNGRSQNILPAEGTQIYKIKRVYSPLEFQAKGESNFIEYKAITDFNAAHFLSQDEYYYQVEQKRNVTGKMCHEIRFINHLGEPVISPYPFKCEFYCMNEGEIESLTIGSIQYHSLDVTSGLSFKNITALSEIKEAVVESTKHWRLISYLSFSPLFLNNSTILKQIVADLHFYSHDDFPKYQKHLMSLDGIIEVKTHAIDLLKKGEPIRGYKMVLKLDPDCFLGEGAMYRFASLLAEIFPFCLSCSSFLQVDVININTQTCWSLPLVMGSRQEI